MNISARWIIQGIFVAGVVRAESLPDGIAVEMGNQKWSSPIWAQSVKGSEHDLASVYTLSMPSTLLDRYANLKFVQSVSSTAVPKIETEISTPSPPIFGAKDALQTLLDMVKTVEGIVLRADHPFPIDFIDKLDELPDDLRGEAEDQILARLEKQLHLPTGKLDWITIARPALLRETQQDASKLSNSSENSKRLEVPPPLVVPRNKGSPIKRETSTEHEYVSTDSDSTAATHTVMRSEAWCAEIDTNQAHSMTHGRWTAVLLINTLPMALAALLRR